MNRADITLGIALWGAALSTLAFLRDYIRTRVKARVTIGYGPTPHLATDSDLLIGQPGNREFPISLFATIVNVGRETMYLGTAEIRSDGGLGMGMPGFHVELRSGQSHTVSFDADQVWAIASYGHTKAVWVAFYDQVGRCYVSPAAMAGKPVRRIDGASLDPEPMPSKLKAPKFAKGDPVRITPDFHGNRLDAGAPSA